MRNKIIKVSIILIFMMFSVCLFNFCFAYSVDTDIELSNTVSLYYKVDSTVENALDVLLYKANFLYNECSTEHKYKTYYMRDNGNLYCIVSDKPIIFECTYKSRYYLRILEDDGTHSLPYCDRYKYDDDTGEWSYDMTFDGNGNFNMPVYSSSVQSYLLTDYTEPVLYGYATVDSTELIQMYPEPIPPTEELIANCDFKVRVSFGEESNIDGYPHDTEILSYNALVIHNLSNWEKYYDVAMSIELSNYQNKLTKHFYYDLYNSSGERLINNERIKSLTNIDLNANDYFTFHTYNTDDNIKLTYKIYQKNTTNLIMTKVIRFNFNSSYLWQDVTGNILEDNTYDSSGSLISGENNKVESNGTNFTDINNNFDFNSTFVFDLDSLQSTLENNVENSKSFFSLITTFLGLLPIWISSLIYFFLTGVIVITLFRMIRGA